MIYGIGCDIIAIDRIKDLVKKSKERFLNRVFSIQEIIKAPDPTSPQHFAYFAKRFAAKEAYAKATKLGIRANITFQSIEVLNDFNNAPYFNKHPLSSNDIKTFLSLSDERNYAIAYVILTKPDLLI